MTLFIFIFLNLSVRLLKYFKYFLFNPLEIEKLSHTETISKLLSVAYFL